MEEFLVVNWYIRASPVSENVKKPVCDKIEFEGDVAIIILLDSSPSTPKQ